MDIKKFKFFQFFLPCLFFKLFLKKGKGYFIKKKILKTYYHFFFETNIFFFDYISSFLFGKKYTVSFHQTKKVTYINHKKKYLFNIDFSFVNKKKGFFFLKFNKFFFFKHNFNKSLYNFFFYNDTKRNLNYKVYKKSISAFVLKK